MTGGYGFIVAAYTAAALVLGGYAALLRHRLKRERQASKSGHQPFQ
jgi:hypothetical protein